MNTKGLGYRQRHMLNYMKQHAQRYCDPFRTYSIERSERSVALSLQKRGLIKIVVDLQENWHIRLA